MTFTPPCYRYDAVDNEDWCICIGSVASYCVLDCGDLSYHSDGIQ